MECVIELIIKGSSGAAETKRRIRETRPQVRWKVNCSKWPQSVACGLSSGVN